MFKWFAVNVVRPLAVSVLISAAIFVLILPKL